MDITVNGRDRYRTVQHMNITVGIRTIARMDTIPKDTIPKNTIPNGCDPEWTQSRMGTIPKERFMRPYAYFKKTINRNIRNYDFIHNDSSTKAGGEGLYVKTV